MSTLGSARLLKSSKGTLPCTQLNPSHVNMRNVLMQNSMHGESLGDVEENVLSQILTGSFSHGKGRRQPLQMAIVSIGLVHFSRFLTK